MKRKQLVLAMRIFAGFMILATILFLLGPFLGGF